MRRPRFRKSPGTTKALVLAVALHVVVIALLIIGFRWPSLSGGDAQVIKAVAIDEEAAQKSAAAEQKRLEEERKRKEAEQRKREEAEQRRVAEERKRQEEARQQVEAERRRKEAEQQRIAAERQQQEEAARRQVVAEQKRLEEERRRLASERERMEQERRRIEEERGRKVDEERKRQEAEQQLAKALAAEEQAERRKRAATAMDKYILLIKQKVSRHWVEPASGGGELEVEIRVRFAAGGEVLNAAIVRSSGNELFDRSVENAVHKASPLPLPEEPELFEEFREIKFVFRRPEGQG